MAGGLPELEPRLDVDAVEVGATSVAGHLGERRHRAVKKVYFMNL